MRAIKINVVEKTVTEVNIAGDYKSMCKELESDGYQHIRITDKDFLWVDVDGLIKEKPLGAFEIYGYPTALAGHGLIIGITRGGENSDCFLSIETVRKYVQFVDVSKLPEPRINTIVIPECENPELN